MEPTPALRREMLDSAVTTPSRPNCNCKRLQVHSREGGAGCCFGCASPAREAACTTARPLAAAQDRAAASPPAAERIGGKAIPPATKAFHATVLCNRGTTTATAGFGSKLWKRF